jgi:ribokinase
VTDAEFARIAGGKGANQAVAAARLGAEVRFVECTGDDSLPEEALAGLREAGAELDVRRAAEPTGVAPILVEASGENEIVVAPGAKRQPAAGGRSRGSPVLCQLEIPLDAVAIAASQAEFSASTRRLRGQSTSSPTSSS